MTEFSYASEGPNIFCLIRTLDQEQFDTWGTEPPVQDFMTGFKNATDTELRLYTKRRVTELKWKGKGDGLCREWIARLDEQSIHDSTVVLQYCMDREDWVQMLADAEIEFHIPGQTDVSDKQIWWMWRVPFGAAFQLFNSVDDGELDMIELYTRPEYLDSEGVLHVDIPRKIVKGEISDAMVHGANCHVTGTV